MLVNALSLCTALLETPPGTGDSDPTSEQSTGEESPNEDKSGTDLGKWIWIKQDKRVRNYHLYARKTFKLPARPTTGTLRVAADSKYKLYINGQYVGKGPVRSGPDCTYYDTFEILRYLKRGTNVLAFHVHYLGEETHSYILGQPGLNCRADIAVGRELGTVATDEAWKIHQAPEWTSQGARISRRLGFQEVYDAQGAIENWNQIGFRAQGWQNAVVVGDDADGGRGVIKPREIPLLSEEKVLPKAVVGVFNSPERSKDTPVGNVAELMSKSALAPLRAGGVKDAQNLLAAEQTTQIRTPRNNKGVVVLLDFGRQVFGNVEIGIESSGRGVVDIGYGELLEDGRVKPDRGRMRYTDRLLLAKGKLDWQGFDTRAFRYMQIEFSRCPKPLALDYVRVNQTTYPIERAGSFECSDELLNDIWKTGAYTAQLCMEDTFINSPWRARAQWWADARIESRVAYYAFGDTHLLAQGLRQIATSQKPDGSMSGVYPTGEEKLIPDSLLLWVFSLLDYYAFANDAEFVRELYPNVRKLMEWFGSYTGSDNLLSRVPGRLFIDLADLDRRGESAALNCMYFQALRVAAVLASVVGEEEDAVAYAEAAGKLKIAINRHLYAPKRGLYAECRTRGQLVDNFSAQTNILAVLFDIADQYQKASILRQVTNGGLPEITTPYFTTHLLEALCATDRHDEALNIIRKKWGAMVKDGATTFWQFFHKEGSLCHGWSAAPARDLIAEYVGIKPEFGARRFAVAPHTGGLRWARGSIATETGPLGVEWKASRNYLTIKVQVPEQITVDLYAPGAPEFRVTLDGKPHPVRFVTLEEGVHRIRIKAVPLPKTPSVKGGEPPARIPQVEIMKDISPRGSMFGPRGTSRRRPGRRSSPKPTNRSKKPADDKRAENRPPESRPPESRPAESRPPESKPLETKPPQQKAAPVSEKQDTSKASAPDQPKRRSGRSRRGRRRPSSKGKNQGQKPEQKPEQRTEQRTDQKTEQRADQKPDQKPEEKQG